MSTQPTWNWDLPVESDSAPDGPGNPGTDTRRGHYGPRTCRICLDTEQPKYPSNVTSTLGFSSASSRPSYVSDDPELGRLLSPCKCKGSQKYVHEGCLNSWRLTNPMAARNYWQCPTCKFNYRLARLHWASMLSSKWAQVALTLTVVVIGIFLLGFIADPILDLWFDPVGTISDTVSSVVADVEALKPSRHEEPASWTDHFAKGFFSLGFVGFVKSLVAMGPWQWLNLRTSGLLGSGRRRGTGRARMDNFNLVFVLIGAFTFLMAIWKAVRAISTRVLNNVSDKVLDVSEDDDDDEVGDEAGPGTKKDQ
ncbi:RING-variant domain-containing protein [Hirsutella rhossiliensis]|uniref:RING-variant domain-containing protein n=1 Tax=Hirsutella rhossiliensis TaxID=111463 RepID=A0A9P8SNT7_9HYPO|nr:RING-variant domain-containing protein [Hirsutella rhossiliensis]KAH0968225.1 RING-variant domain-containing protein [Hirsutella rhossiliensis]